MSFDWRLYIQLAYELITHQRTADLQEAYLRSAISRSYYGVYCISRNFLISKGINIPQVDTHKFVRNEYKGACDKEEKKIGYDLDRLWLDRKDADYEDRANIDQNRTKTAHQMATRILQRLHNLGAI